MQSLSQTLINRIINLPRQFPATNRLFFHIGFILLKLKPNRKKMHELKKEEKGKSEPLKRDRNPGSSAKQAIFSFRQAFSFWATWPRLVFFNITFRMPRQDYTHLKDYQAFASVLFTQSFPVRIPGRRLIEAICVLAPIKKYLALSYFS